jgi:curved DNA-binding protein CbpA
MNEPIDYYQLLHVHPDAPAEIIRSSYRTLMQSLRNHPDLGGNHDYAAKINEAYAVLSDPEKRAQYDLARAPTKPAVSDKAATRDEVDPLKPRGNCLFCGTAYLLKRELRADDLCTACASPLFPARRHRLDNSGQRMLGRIRQERTMTCYTRWPQATGFEVEMRDLSLNGMQLHTTFAAEKDRLLKLDSGFCRALARVAYCRRESQHGWLLGVEFVTLVFASARGNFVSASA